MLCKSIRELCILIHSPILSEGSCEQRSADVSARICLLILLTLNVLIRTDLCSFAIYERSQESINSGLCLRRSLYGGFRAL